MFETILKQDSYRRGPISHPHTSHTVKLYIILAEVTTEMVTTDVVLNHSGWQGDAIRPQLMGLLSVATQASFTPSHSSMYMHRYMY